MTPEERAEKEKCEDCPTRFERLPGKNGQKLCPECAFNRELKRNRANARKRGLERKKARAIKKPKSNRKVFASAKRRQRILSLPWYLKPDPVNRTATRR